MFRVEGMRCAMKRPGGRVFSFALLLLIIKNVNLIVYRI